MTYTRKTHDVYEIEQDWGTGFEYILTCEDYQDARAQLRCYRENEPDTPARIRKHREPWRAALFVGVFPGGLVYADRETFVHGDYKRLALLSFSTLHLEIEPDAPAHFRRLIAEDAAQVQSRRGEVYTISTCGQSVVLGQ